MQPQSIIANNHCCTGPVSMTDNLKAHKERLRLSKVPHEVTPITSGISGTASSYSDFAIIYQIPLSWYTFSPADFYESSANCSYASYLVMHPHPLRLTSNCEIPLVVWAILMANYDIQMELRIAAEWSQLSSTTLYHIIRFKTSSTELPYLDL